jgi:hypothetical protein
MEGFISPLLARRPGDGLRSCVLFFQAFPGLDEQVAQMDQEMLVPGLPPKVGCWLEVVKPGVIPRRTAAVRARCGQAQGELMELVLHNNLLSGANGRRDNLLFSSLIIIYGNIVLSIGNIKIIYTYFKNFNISL